MNQRTEIGLGLNLTEEQARAIYGQGEDAVMFALLAQAMSLAEQLAQAAATSHQTPSTPSGMQPPYQKLTTSSRGKNTLGRKNGRIGNHRATPTVNRMCQVSPFATRM